MRLLGKLTCKTFLSFSILLHIHSLESFISLLASISQLLSQRVQSEDRD